MNNNKLFSLKNPTHFLALGFGSGLINPAPGTWGTLAAVPLYYLLMQLPQTAYYGVTAYYAITALVCIVGVYLCGKAAKDAGVHDHKAIVWDEIAGFLITMVAAPAVHIIWVAVGFALFRFFDVLKPFPINIIDKKVYGGLGIMLDDILAGVFAAISLHFIAVGYLKYIDYLHYAQ